MKFNWPLKIIILLSFLIPLAFSSQTFDPFGIPKMTIFCLAIGFLLIMVLINYKPLLKLPKYLIWAFSFFLLMQAFQTLRLLNIPAGLFGAYGQSESFLVQLGFITICLAGFLFIGDEQARIKIRTTILITIFFISIYGIFQYLYGDPLSKAIFIRVKSFLGDPNALGVYLILSIPMLLIELKQNFRHWTRYPIGGCLFIAITTLFLSFSRSAWLGFIISLFPFTYQAILRFKQQSAKQTRIFMITVLFIILAGVFTGQILTHFQPQSHQDYTLESRVSSMAQGNDSGRAIIWSIAWRTFKNAPLLGYGIGTFQVNFHQYKSAAALKFWSPERDLREVHNETLHYLATQGIIGLLAYFGLLAALFLAARIGGLFRTTISFEKTAFWSGVLGYLCYVQFNYPLIHYSFLFWLYLGILLRLAVPPIKKPLIHNLKPVVIIFAVLFILLWSYFSINIFRADVCYRSAFDKTRFHHYEQSFANYRKAISLTPWIYHYQYRYGVSLFRASLWEAKNHRHDLSLKYLHLAKDNLISLTKNNPDRYESLFLLGQVNENLGEFAAAAHNYQKALRLYPLNYKISFRLAKVWLLLNNNAKFWETFRAGSKIAPDYMDGMLEKEGLLPGELIKK